MTPAQQKQYASISVLQCPTQVERRPHGLAAVTTRSWRDLFRKRRWWRCHFCSFREEIVSSEAKLPTHIWGQDTAVCVRCGMSVRDESRSYLECWG